MQYLEWLGSEAEHMAPLGSLSQPIFVIDGTYLVTAMTIWRQGGLGGAERHFQSVNRLIRQRLEERMNQDSRDERNSEKEEKMKATARVLAAAAALTIAQAGTAGEFPDWKGMWKMETGEAEVLDEAHIRMKNSGRVFRILGIARLENPEQAQIAREGIDGLISGRKLDCWWLPEPAAQGNPMAADPDGTPYGACGVRKVAYARCKRGANCILHGEIIKRGYGTLQGGAWEQRSKGASEAMAKRKVFEREARTQGIGIWAE